MPFRSEAQRRYMYSAHPAIAKRWSDEYAAAGKLPERVAKKKKKKRGRKKKAKAY